LITPFSGFDGDGTRCTWVGVCGVNHGGCYPQASCVENPGKYFFSSMIQCLLLYCHIIDKYLTKGGNFKDDHPNMVQENELCDVLCDVVLSDGNNL